jgi:phosphohistidine phosphatase
MRVLYVLRHAKSSWDDPTLGDHDRPLAARGRRAAPLVGAHMRRHGIAPQLILCSSSRRTRDTLQLLGDVSPGADVVVDDDLYHATAPAWLARLRAVPATIRDVLVIGHNPALQRLVLMLAGAGGQREQVARKFPTAALATLHAPIDGWADLAEGGAHLAAVVRPRDLGTGG